MEPILDLERPIVDGRPARVFVGGHGEPLVLVHGGWAGAAAHWSSVWGPLAEHFRVIAPDLPGVGDASTPGLGSIRAYGQWLGRLLDALDVPSAWLVGNSFGVSVVSRFAFDEPARCRGLVMVNGFPLPTTPPLLRWLGERRLGKRVVQAIEKRVAYTPAALDRAFADKARIPEEIRAVVRQEHPPQVASLADVIVEGGGSRGTLPVPPLLLWGEDDHLPGTGKKSAEKLRGSFPGAKLVFVPGAGHMPQVENPSAFVDALVPFVERQQPS